jgi:hypothetical protein
MRSGVVGKVAQLRLMAAALHISAYCTLIKNKQRHATEGSQEAGIAAVAASKREMSAPGDGDHLFRLKTTSDSN